MLGYFAYMYAWFPWRSEEGAEFPWTGVIDGCEDVVEGCSFVPSFPDSK